MAQRSAFAPLTHDLLVSRDLTPEEREAHAADPRPGRWLGEAFADGRALTHNETDRLIRAEIVMRARPEERADLERMIGKPRAVDLGNSPHSGRAARLSDFYAGRTEGRETTWFHRALRFAHVQRGGIDSDPMVRLLAFRAWGDREVGEIFEQRRGTAITSIVGRVPGVTSVEVYEATVNRGEIAVVIDHRSEHYTLSLAVRSAIAAGIVTLGTEGSQREGGRWFTPATWALYDSWPSNPDRQLRVLSDCIIEVRQDGEVVYYPR